MSEDSAGGPGETARVLVSVIIPTYNRAVSLTRALKSLSRVYFPRELWEVVIVDNNSTDHTRAVAEEARENLGLNIHYVKEKRLSFTVARHTGAEAAHSDILIYIDDDVTVEKGWMKAVVEGFNLGPDVGMVGGPVRPAFEAEPPEWIHRMNPIWLSLWEPKGGINEVNGVPGPNLGVRKSVLNEVGGFPPDTIGVEAEGNPGTIEKIYISGGDGGLSEKISAAGYRIMFMPDAIVYHHIPPVRLTRRWWHSRFSGEASYHAITHQYFNHLKPVELYARGLRHLAAIPVMGLLGVFSFLSARLPEREYCAFRASYYATRAKVEFALARHPDLADKLWEIGLTGVVSDEYQELLKLVTWR